MNFTLKTLVPGVSFDSGKKGHEQQCEDGVDGENSKLRSERKKSRTDIMDRVGALTGHVKQLVGTLAAACDGNSLNEGLPANSPTGDLDKQLRLQESLNINMDMYNKRNSCPEYVKKYLEDSLKAAVSQLRQIQGLNDTYK